MATIADLTNELTRYFGATPTELHNIIAGSGFPMENIPAETSSAASIISKFLIVINRKETQKKLDVFKNISKNAPDGKLIKAVFLKLKTEKTKTDFNSLLETIDLTEVNIPGTEGWKRNNNYDSAWIEERIKVILGDDVTVQDIESCPGNEKQYSEVEGGRECCQPECILGIPTLCLAGELVRLKEATSETFSLATQIKHVLNAARAIADARNPEGTKAGNTLQKRNIVAMINALKELKQVLSIMGKSRTHTAMKAANEGDEPRKVRDPIGEWTHFEEFLKHRIDSNNLFRGLARTCEKLYEKKRLDELRIQTTPDELRKQLESDSELQDLLETLTHKNYQSLPARLVEIAHERLSSTVPAFRETPLEEWTSFGVETYLFDSIDSLPHNVTSGRRIFQTSRG